jgi:hypothetical protein
MSCEAGHHIWRLAETDFYVWREDSADVERKTIFGNKVYYADWHYGRVDKFYCSVCRDFVTDRIEAIGDYSRWPEWWSWQGKEQMDFPMKHWRPHSMDWGCQPHRVFNVLTDQWINYG